MYHLELKQLKIMADDSPVPIVRDLDVRIPEGGIVGLVGESGSGKSTTALAITDLLPPQFRVASGEIVLEGRDLLGLPPRERRARLASRVGFIYQDALTALNPLMRIGRQVGELLTLRGEEKAAVREAVLEALRSVGLTDAEAVYRAYPHELSGGMRQRVLIAMALIGKPCLLIADESTTALDRRLSDQIIDLLREENERRGTSILFISHDLASVARLCEDLLVMREGIVVEEGKTSEIMAEPKHAYTKMLLAALPTPEKKGRLLGQEGDAGLLSELEAEDGAVISETKVLEIRGLCAGYGDDDHVLEEIELDIRRGEFVGLLGESGSGKTTIARVLTGQLPASRGEVIYRGQDILHLAGRKRRVATEGLGMIFQDPYSSLDPHMTIYRQIEEPLIIAGIKDKTLRQARVHAILDAVDLDRSLGSRLPANLSGGQRQRVAIAIAMILEPELLIADEAVASLDVSVQAQILNLLLRLRRQFDFSCLFIAHDLDVIYHLSDRVAVLYEGKIVEFASAEDVFRTPEHPYTRDLIGRMQQKRVGQGGRNSP